MTGTGRMGTKGVLLLALEGVEQVSVVNDCVLDVFGQFETGGEYLLDEGVVVVASRCESFEFASGSRLDC